jgi:hypothetical protein
MIDPAMLLTIASVNEGVLVEEGSDEKKNDGGGRRRKDLFGGALQKGNAGRGSASWLSDMAREKKCRAGDSTNHGPGI